MTEILKNSLTGTGLSGEARLPADNAAPVQELLAQCPAHAPTPLVDLPGIAEEIPISSLVVKDERARMGLGSFKALGAAYAIARAAASAAERDWATALADRVFVTASAGNHGLSVAAGARIFGAKAVIYLSATVPEPFADRLRRAGAEVRRAGASYEESMDAAAAAAAEHGWTLLSDSSWPGYEEMPWRVMEGYLQMAAEVIETLESPPTHVLLQAGVGGMAAALAALFRRAWGDVPEIVVVEPEAAPALLESVRAESLVTTDGPVSEMGRLDCKTPSMIALAGLARDADLFVTVSEAEAKAAVGRLSAEGVATTPSGAAGIAALLARRPAMPASARVLAIISEGPEDG
jgi:diaminopropionate ammonia-lyase